MDWTLLVEVVYKSVLFSKVRADLHPIEFQGFLEFDSNGGAPVKHSLSWLSWIFLDAVVRFWL